MFAQIWQIFIGKHANKCRHPTRSCLTFYSGAGKPYTGRLRSLALTALAQGAPGLPDRQAGAFSVAVY
jgi:hypothetical protein